MKLVIFHDYLICDSIIVIYSFCKVGINSVELLQNGMVVEEVTCDELDSFVQEFDNGGHVVPFETEFTPYSEAEDWYD